MPGPRRLFLILAATMVAVAVALTLLLPPRPLPAGAAGDGWPAVRMVLEVEGSLIHPACRCLYEYLRDERGRWRLEVIGGREPARVGDWWLFDGHRWIAYVSSRMERPEVVERGPDLEASVLLSPAVGARVDDLLTSSRGMLMSQDRMLGRTTNVVEVRWTEPAGSRVERYWVLPGASLVLRYEYGESSRLSSWLQVRQLVFRPPIPPDAFIPGP